MCYLCKKIVEEILDHEVACWQESLKQYVCQMRASCFVELMEKMNDHIRLVKNLDEHICYQKVLIEIQSYLPAWHDHGEGSVWLLRSMSMAQMGQHDYDAALYTIDEALAMAKVKHLSLHNGALVARLISNKLGLLGVLNRPNIAAKFAESIHQDSAYNVTDLRTAEFYYNWAICLLDLREFSQLKMLMDDYQLHIGDRKYTDAVERARGIADFYGKCYCDLGEFSLSEVLLMEAIDTLEDEQGHYYFIAYYYLTKLYLRQGAFTQAHQILAKIMPMLTEERLGSQRIAEFNLLWGEILVELRQFRAAQIRLSSLLKQNSYIQQEAFARLRCQWTLANSLVQSARLNNKFTQNAFNKAQAYLHDCKALARVHYPRWLQIIDLTLALLNVEWGRTKSEQSFLIKGLSLILSVIDDFGDVEYSIRLIEAQLLKAYIYTELGELDKAQFVLNELSLDTLPSYLAVIYHYVEGLTFSKAKLYARAYRALLEAVTLSVDSRRLASHSIHIGDYFTSEMVFNELLDVCVASRNWHRVWELSDLAQTTRLQTVLSLEERYKTILAQSDDPCIVQRINVLLQEINTLRGRISNLNGQATGWFDKADRKSPLPVEQEAASYHQIYQLEQVLEDKYKELSQFDQEASINDVTVTSLSQSLDSKTTLIKYVQRTDKVVILILRNNQDRPLTAVEVNIPFADVTSLIQQFTYELHQEFWSILGSLIQYNSNLSVSFARKVYDGLLKDVIEVLSALYRVLWEPIRGIVQEYTNAVIIFDDTFSRLPFCALYDPERGKYLTEQIVLSYAPSGSVYALCKKRAERRVNQLGTMVTLLGNEGKGKRKLPSANREIGAVALSFQQKKYSPKQINQFLSTHGTSLVQSRGFPTYENLKRFVPNSIVLHVAAHGQTNYQSPMFSFIELGKIDSASVFEPDHIYVYELAALNLHQLDLVFLTACQSGNLKSIGGELFGLQWGVFQAGAYALGANLMDVNDHYSAEMMRIFYENYDPGYDKAKALQIAQTNLINAPKNNQLRIDFGSHPYVWAPFAIFGFAQATV